MGRLIVICEGGIHTVEYIHKHGVYPGALVLEPSKFQEMVPYLTEEDDILLIIKGLTDFTMTEVYSLLSKFEEHNGKVKSTTVLSNMMLGVIPYEYYYYENDLFYGNVYKVVKNKKYEVNSQGEVVTDSKVPNVLGKKRKEKTEVKVDKTNPVMFAFKRYNDKTVKMQIYGKITKEKPQQNDLDIIGGITFVDLFKEK